MIASKFPTIIQDKYKNTYQKNSHYYFFNDHHLASAEISSISFLKISKHFSWFVWID